MPTSPPKRHTSANNKNSTKCSPWKRLFMEAEHLRRKTIARWENDSHEFSRTISDGETMIKILQDELKHRRIMHTTQREVIEAMQKTMETNGIPVKRTMASLSNCRAADDEICPLSLAPINQSPLPLCNELGPCTLSLNPMKPEHKCAELVCGHRFNSMWLIYHFVESGTFRCPICRCGPSVFRFQRDELPPVVCKMLDMIKEMKNKGSGL